MEGLRICHAVLLQHTPAAVDLCSWNESRAPIFGSRTQGTVDILN